MTHVEAPPVEPLIPKEDHVAQEAMKNFMEYDKAYFEHLGSVATGGLNNPDHLAHRKAEAAWNDASKALALGKTSQG